MWRTDVQNLDQCFNDSPRDKTRNVGAMQDLEIDKHGHEADAIAFSRLYSKK